MSMQVVFLTTVHGRDDTRVFHKEANDIGALGGLDLTVIVADGKGDEIREFYDIYDIGGFSNRAKRFLLGSIKSYFAVKKLKPRVVHFHDPELMLIAWLLTFSGCIVIYDVHENVPEDIKDKYWLPISIRGAVSWCYKIAERLCISRFRTIVAATPDIFGCYPAQKALLVQNFPRLDEFPVGEGARKKFDPYVSYLGAITRIRGIDNVIRAMSIVSQDGLAVRFKIGGFFQQSDHYRSLAAYPEWRFVDFLGVVERGEIYDYLSNSLCGVVCFLPAHNHINAQPNKLFEYMAAGIPVIASDFPLWRRIIEGYDCGILVNPESPEEIAQAICFFLRNEQRREQMGKNGAMAVRNCLNWQAESTKLQSVYLDIIQEVRDV